MSKIPFNMKYRPQIESGEYLLIDTLDRPIRIVEWPEQRKDGKIVYEATTTGGWLVKGLVGTDGKIANEDTGTVVRELIIVTPDIVGLTDFEKAVREALSLEVHASEEDTIKEQAKHLLALAYAEFTKEMPMPEDTVLFQKGVAEGRRLERDDMPHWMKASPKNAEETTALVPLVDGDDRDFLLVHKGHTVYLSDLYDNLPKEDKQ